MLTNTCTEIHLDNTHDVAQTLVISLANCSEDEFALGARTLGSEETGLFRRGRALE